MRTIPAALAAFLILLAGCAGAPKTAPAKPTKAAQAEDEGDAEEAAESTAKPEKEGSGSKMEGSSKAAGEKKPVAPVGPPVAAREVKPEELAAAEFGEPKHAMSLPKDWTAATSPANMIRIFTAAVPKYEDDEKGAELTVSKAMGGWEANVKRYQEFFGGAESVKKNEELATAGGVKVHYALFKGTYEAPSFPGMGGGGTFNDYAMGVAMLTVDDGTYFIKILGPRHTVEWQENGFLEALKSFK